MSKITLQDIENNVDKQEFLISGRHTLCFLKMKNGFEVIGHSAVVDPAEFNEIKGRNFAREDAIKQAWPLMGYQLRSKLALIEGAGDPTGDILKLGTQVKTYVGTKVVHATPMTRQGWCDLRGWDLPLGEVGSDEGYLVQYVDGGRPNVHGFSGYISWSPKDVFELAYGQGKPQESGNFLDRLRVEIDQNANRLKKLTSFVQGPALVALAPEDQQNLREQMLLMRQLDQLLTRRYERAMDKVK